MDSETQQQPTQMDLVLSQTLHWSREVAIMAGIFALRSSHENIIIQFKLRAQAVLPKVGDVQNGCVKTS